MATPKTKIYHSIYIEDEGVLIDTPEKIKLFMESEEDEFEIKKVKLTKNEYDNLPEMCEVV